MLQIDIRHIHTPRICDFATVSLGLCAVMRNCCSYALFDVVIGFLVFSIYYFSFHINVCSYMAIMTPEDTVNRR